MKNLFENNAVKRYNKNKKNYSSFIQETNASTKEYRIGNEDSLDNFIYISPTPTGRNTEVFFNPVDVVEEIFVTKTSRLDHKDEKVAVLSFANFTKPGGYFLEGSMAQEEALCMHSTLYNCLENNAEFFEQNLAYFKAQEKKDNSYPSLYLNAGLYLPKIKFFDPENFRSAVEVDVISVAAPNFAGHSFSFFARGDKNEDRKTFYETNSKVLKSRIEFVLDIAKDNNVDVLILGGFGCGVFGQDATEVATHFKELLNTKHKDVFKKVIFPFRVTSLHGKDYENYNAFEKVFMFS